MTIQPVYLSSSAVNAEFHESSRGEQSFCTPPICTHLLIHIYVLVIDDVKDQMFCLLFLFSVENYYNMIKQYCQWYESEPIKH